MAAAASAVHLRQEIDAAASASTWQPSTMSSSRLSSAKSWLIPPSDGMNSIADGIGADTMPASWNAPLGMRCHLPGAMPFGRGFDVRLQARPCGSARSARGVGGPRS